MLHIYVYTLDTYINQYTKYNEDINAAVYIQTNYIVYSYEDKPKLLFNY